MLDILNKPEELRMDFLLKGKIKDKGLEHGSIARSILCPSLVSHRNWVFARQKLQRKQVGKTRKIGRKIREIDLCQNFCFDLFRDLQKLSEKFVK